MATRVVHVKRSRYTVYIGRPSIWGNPFRIGADGTRDEVIAKYRDYILSRPDLLAQLHTLRGQVLGCWCKPQRCHGDVLAELAESWAPTSAPGAVPGAGQPPHHPNSDPQTTPQTLDKHTTNMQELGTPTTEGTAMQMSERLYGLAGRARHAAAMAERYPSERTNARAALEWRRFAFAARQEHDELGDPVTREQVRREQRRLDGQE